MSNVRMKVCFLDLVYVCMYIHVYMYVCMYDVCVPGTMYVCVLLYYSSTTT